MSILSTICKIFAFVLKVFKLVVEAVAEAVKLVLTALVDVLDTLLESIGENILSGSSLWVLLLGGAGLIYFMSKKEDKASERNEVVNV